VQRVEKDLEVQPEVQPEWLSYTQCRRITGLSRGTIRKIIDSGSVKAAKVGSRTLINRRSLLEYLDRQSYAGRSRYKAAALRAQTTEEGGA
jgi:excisionase family DNA binding protein